MTIYTDGSCLGNGKTQNSGGFGVVVVDNNKVIKAYSKKNENTTNNREEIRAILWAMINYGTKLGNWTLIPTVYSDSAYCVNTFNEWMFNWQKKGWIKSDKKVPENLDLIQAYYDLFQQGYRIDLQKVKGHAGNQWNELADKLATGAITTEEVMEIYG